MRRNCNITSPQLVDDLSWVGAGVSLIWFLTLLVCPANTYTSPQGWWEAMDFLLPCSQSWCRKLWAACDSNHSLPAGWVGVGSGCWASTFSLSVSFSDTLEQTLKLARTDFMISLLFIVVRRRRSWILCCGWVITLDSGGATTVVAWLLVDTETATINKYLFTGNTYWAKREKTPFDRCCDNSKSLRADKFPSMMLVMPFFVGTCKTFAIHPPPLCFGDLPFGLSFGFPSFCPSVPCLLW